MPIDWSIAWFPRLNMRCYLHYCEIDANNPADFYHGLLIRHNNPPGNAPLNNPSEEQEWEWEARASAEYD